MSNARGLRSPIRPGLIIREALEALGEAAIADLHATYRDRVREHNDMFPERPRSPMTYENFLKYFYFIRRLGLVEFVREEPMQIVPETPAGENPLLSIRLDGGQALQGGRQGTIQTSTRRIYRLSPTGIEEELAWHNPQGSLRGEKSLRPI